jgi:cystathionine gamma-synthase/methionine-gamma-lyase
MEKKINLYTAAVHAGDRKPPAAAIPVTTPIHAATSFFYPSVAELDRVFAREQEGFAYARYGNPTNQALEELVCTLENGAAALACSSGMAALEMAVHTALTDRRKSILCSHSVYGATVSLLTKVFEPLGIEVRFIDVCDLAALEKALADRPGCLLLETISNPLLRVPALDQITPLARQAGSAVIVDNTFATPLMVRPLELGAHLVVHSMTKYLAGHGDVLAGIVVADQDHAEILRALSRIYGPVLGPFEAYLAMRGIKTFPLRFERQCRNACRLASWLASHPRIARVHYPQDPAHPDAQAIGRLFPKELYGAMISFELKDAGRDEIFAFMDRLRLIVRATSLGDVHTMILYPAMSSHREVSPKQRQRMGITDSLLRISVGIEAFEDILGDLEQALDS